MNVNEFLEMNDLLGTGDLLKIFEENHIDMTVLQTMSETDFKEVGITSFGLRRKLALAVQKLKSPAFDDSASSMTSDESEIASTSETNCPDVVFPTRPSSSLSSSSPQISTPNLSSSSPQISTPKSSSNAYSMGPFTSPLDFSIEEILQNGAGGQPVLDALRKGQLASSDRKVLVRLVVSHLVEKVGHLYPSSHQKVALAKAITDQFTCTKDTTLGAKGYELYYSNGHGFLEYRLKTIRARQPALKKAVTKRKAVDSDDDDDVGSIEPEIDTLQKVEWMKYHAPTRDNEATIRQNLKDSFKFRRNWVTCNDPSVTEFIAEYPRIRDMPNLINLEFDLMFPNGGSNFITDWHYVYANAILKVAKQQPSVALKHVLIKFKDENDDLCALHLLASMLPTSNYRTKTSGSTAASRSASVLSLMQSRPTGTDIEHFLKDKTNKQPFLLCLGDELKPNDFYIISDAASIPAGKTVIEAFDRLFKCFFVFNVHYPPSLMPFYNFVEKVIYKIDIRGKVFPQVRALSAQLKTVREELDQE